MLLAMLLSASNSAFADISHRTRGIGVYPGSLDEFAGLKLIVDNSYHNLALMHTTFSSGSEDYNLTAQLATDGIVSAALPPSVKVTVNGDVLLLRDQCKSFDGNIHSDNVINGEKGYIQYDWRGMKVNTGRLSLDAVAVYYPGKAGKGYKISVLASSNGKQWHVIGGVSSFKMPGVEAKFKMSSDPNKQWSVDKLPLRQVKMTIPVKNGSYSHLRIVTEMPGCAYWRFYESLFTKDERGMIPSYNFASAWASPIIKKGSDETQWLYVDFGARADFRKIVLHWLQKPLAGMIQVSDDCLKWHDIMSLPQSSDNFQEFVCNGRGRYVRILMEKVNDSRQYVLSEIEIWGKGGISPKLGSPVNADILLQKHEVNIGSNWQLCRKGDNHWIPATVPGTALVSYINIKAVPENTYANNMRQISESYFNSDFIYRTHFTLTSLPANHVYINFDGINWKSVVKVNGHLVGTTQGAFIRSRFEISRYLKMGENSLTVDVICNDHIGVVKEKIATSTDLNGGVLGADNPTFHASIGWDWITSTPGRDLGIWNDTYLSMDNGLHVSNPMVTTMLNLPDTIASIKPTVTVQNSTDKIKESILEGWIGNIRFSKKIRVAPRNSCEVSFAPEDFSQLRNQRMNLWWPNGYGQPYLYDAGFAIDGDTIRYKAGIRQMEYRNLEKKATIYINGKRLDPIGGNWGFSEINLRYRGRDYDAAIKYHRDMNFTMIRNWVGQIGDEEFYDACDKYGIMVWQDFWLANPWDGPDPHDEGMFMENAVDVISKIRRHPSIALYVGRNEGFPPKSLDARLRQAVKKYHPTIGYIPSSADKGVSGHGPYRVMPCNKWYFQRQLGKLHSERGVPNVPSIESMSRMLTPKGLWPIGDAWGQHDFTLEGAPNVLTFYDMMNKNFGQAENVKQFVDWAQWINYDTHRAMYESESINRLGLLMWMSHPCWPSTIWQTYDYYLEPTSGYFAIKKACEPLHIFYNPDNGEILVRNIFSGKHQLSAKIEYFDLNGKLTNVDTYIIAINNDETKSIASVRSISNSEDLRFLRLNLVENGMTVSTNTYVLGKEENNFHSLKTLGLADVKRICRFWKEGNCWLGEIKVTNKSDFPALMIRLNLKGNDGEQILPVIYSDNYFHLMPSESRTIKINWLDEDSRDCKPEVSVTGFNL